MCIFAIHVLSAWKIKNKILGGKHLTEAGCLPKYVVACTLNNGLISTQPIKSKTLIILRVYCTF